MSRWTNFSIDERKAMILAVSQAKQIDEAAAEKDWWVTAVLFALFHTRIGEYFLFKGGTSLSKGWNIINRFSEDIDIALSRDFFVNERKFQYTGNSFRKQIQKLRKEAQDYLFGEFKAMLVNKFAELGLDVTVLTDNEIPDEDMEPRKIDHDKDPTVIYVFYPSLYGSKETYAQPVIKIEISVSSMVEPFEKRRIASLVEQVYQGEDVDSDFVQDIPTVSPTRTFLEKAFLLCEELQKEHPRTFRMSRHFYDLEKLMQTPYCEMALKDITLYHEVVQHRQKFYHVDAEKEMPANIQIVPSEALMPSFEADYNEMRKSFIYGQSLGFFELMSRMKELQERFRALNE